MPFEAVGYTGKDMGKEKNYECYSATDKAIYRRLITLMSKLR